MSKAICIDCDHREMRIVVGNSGLTGITVEQFLSAPLDIPADEEFLESPRIGEVLHQLLKTAGVRSGSAVVTIPRSSVELRIIHVPTVDKNELPDLVRFAAQRHFANVGENWPLDFIPLGQTPDGMTEVLASSINPHRIERIQKLLESCGLKLGQLVLRPMVASAVALLKRPELKNHCTLFIDLLQQEADMAIVDGKHVVFMRTIRFDSDQDAAERSKTLSGEVKRSLLSAASQNPDLKVSNVLIWGDANSSVDLCESMSEKIGLPVSYINPLDLVEASANAKESVGADVGKFAAAIGGLLAPTHHEHLIDFAKPRKRVIKQTPVRKYALAGAVGALVLGYLAYSYYSTHAELNAEKAELTEKLNSNKETTKTALAKEAEWKKIESFLVGSPDWLEEIEYLSEKSLPAEQTIFTSTTLSIEPKTSQPIISSKFISTDRENATLLQDSLRDENHNVQSTGVTPTNSAIGGYPWGADLTIQVHRKKTVDPRKWPTPVPSKSPVEEVEAN